MQKFYHSGSGKISEDSRETFNFKLVLASNEDDEEDSRKINIQ